MHCLEEARDERPGVFGGIPPPVQLVDEHHDPLVAGDLPERRHQGVYLLELVELLQFAGPDTRLVFPELDAFHPLQIGDQGGQFAGLLIGVIVPDVFVNVVSGALLDRRPLFRDLLHEQDVDQVLPGHRVRAELGPGAVLLGGHRLAEQFVGVVLRRELDDETARIPLALRQDLENRALPDSPAADHDPLRAAADPFIGFGFDEIFAEATLDITLRRRRPEVDPGKRSSGQGDACHGSLPGAAPFARA